MIEASLREKGFLTWEDCLENENKLPFHKKRRARFKQEIMKSREMAANNDIAYLVSSFPVSEQWRILASYFDKATYIDLETTGLSRYSSHVSVIAAYHHGESRTFVYGENLDEFLDLADDADLLVTFNGSSFDIPFIEKTFSIPSLECPHIDLRWVAWHAGYRGGLKSIERLLDVTRPGDIQGIDGFEAVDLFYRWQNGDKEARRLLVQYCVADVMSTYLVAERLLRLSGCTIGLSDTALIEREISKWGNNVKYERVLSGSPI